MFRAISSSILRSTRLWYNAPAMLPAGSIAGALYHKLQRQSSAPEDGRNYRPKHVKLIEIINKIVTVASSCLFILLYYSNIISEPRTNSRNRSLQNTKINDH